MSGEEHCPVFKNDRKVYLFGTDRYVYMCGGQVDLITLIDALWPNQFSRLHEALNKVALRRNRGFSHHTAEGVVRMMAECSTASLVKPLKAVFRAAGLDPNDVAAMMLTQIWQHVLAKASENRQNTLLDNVHWNIVNAASRLKKVNIEEYIREYPDHQYVARTLDNLNKTKRRKVGDETSTE